MDTQLVASTFLLSLVTYFSVFSLGLLPAFVTYQRGAWRPSGLRDGVRSGLAAVGGMTFTYLVVALPAAAIWGKIPAHRFFATALGLAFVAVGAFLALRAVKVPPTLAALVRGRRAQFALGAVYGVAALGVTHYCPELVVAYLRAGQVSDASWIFAAYLGGKGLLLLVAFAVAGALPRIQGAWAGARWVAGTPLAAAGLYVVAALALGLPLMPPFEAGH